MHVLLEIIFGLLQLMWLWLVAIYKAVAPVSVQHKKDVAGWTVLITGAGSGIGRLMAMRFAVLGCRLVLWDINESGNQETQDQIKAALPKPEVFAFTVDLSKRENVYQVAEEVKKNVGDVDILVNNAGIVTGTQFLDSPDSLNVKTMEVNSMAHFWTVKAFLPAMLKKDKGHLVTVASSAGLFTAPGMVDYCASKFAAIGFHDSLRGEIAKLGKKGVKTTVVCPYLINTGMFEGASSGTGLQGLDPEYMADKIVQSVLTDQEMLLVPKDLYIFYILRGIIPISVGLLMEKATGVTNFMDNFKGRAAGKPKAS